MSNKNLITVWKSILSEDTTTAKKEASEYINETAARILKAIMEDEGELAIPSEVSGDVSGEGVPVIVSYSDPDGDCVYDDDIISVSGKDDSDMNGYEKGTRYISFIYDSEDEANEAISRIGDLSDSIPELSVESSQPAEEQIDTDEVTDDDGTVTDDETSTEVEEDSGSSNCIVLSFKSDGDETIVNELRERGFDITKTDIDDSGNRIIHIEASEEAIPEIEATLSEIGLDNYDLESCDEDVVAEDEEDDDATEGGTEGEEPADNSDIADTFDTLATSLETLKAELAAQGISLDQDATLNGEGDEDSSDVTGLEEAFLGYEDVKKPSNVDGADDTKSPIISTPTKDRLRPASPIKSPAGKLTGDGTKAEPAPSVKELPASKNTVKGNVAKTYTKVSKEGDKSAKINSKDGFGEEGKNSIID